MELKCEARRWQKEASYLDLWGRVWFLFSCRMCAFTFKYLGTVGVLLFTTEDTKTLVSVPERPQDGTKKGFYQEQRALESSHTSAPQTPDPGRPLTVRPQFPCLWSGDDCSCPVFPLQGAILGIEWDNNRENTLKRQSETQGIIPATQPWFQRVILRKMLPVTKERGGGEGWWMSRAWALSCLWDCPGWVKSL